MKRSFLLLASLSVMLVVLACQPEPKLEYVKYVNDSAVPRITAEEAKKEYDAGRAVFVDSRGQAAFDSEHLPGALVVSSESEFEKLPKGKKIIVYCS